MSLLNYGIMNDTYIIDTTSLISYFHNIFEVSSVISKNSIDIIEKGFNGELKLIIPSIVFIEIFCKWYLTQEKIERIRYEMFLNIKDQEKIHICPIEIEVLQNVAIIAGINSDIKFDNHDKQVLATAMMYSCPLITSDKKIMKFVKKYKVIPEILN
jgi:predicted nucleic acid-binding protein